MEASGRKRKGSWAVGTSGEGEGKRIKGERGRDSGFFEESEEREEMREGLKKEE